MTSPSIPTAAKLAFLQSPEAYPHPAHALSMVETHLAWVFLAGDFVYKLKKPVQTPYLDYQSPAARRRFCEEEVRLNRRLAPHVYLGVLPLTATPQGTIELDGAGEPVDWLVHMRRLPRERTLDYLVDTGTVPDHAPDRVAEVLARFYGNLPPANPACASTLEFMRKLIDENRRVLRSMPAEWDGIDVNAVFAMQQTFLDANSSLFTERERAGRVIEGHGDLRLQHIYLLDRPVVIDCLEFNRDLRIMDTASELAFLSLECTRHGAQALGDAILTACNAALDDAPPAGLIRFYRAYHACMRAKLAIWRLLDHPERKQNYLAKLRSYLRLAEESLNQPVD